ncbi:MAG TPA: DinB family protein, partial [Longimicrobiaceae bacterium]|nr:DinB family protein [Longimicrobiaceae bacterium]
MTDTAAPPSSRPAAFGDLEQELATTRRVLERVPDEHWNWRPHDKSMTLGRLASHLAELPYLGAAVMQHEAFDVATDRPKRDDPTNREELLRAFDQAASALTAAVDAAPADAWGKTWQLKAAGEVFISLPRAAALRVMAISHPIHHRGQLSVYLRL